MKKKPSQDEQDELEISELAAERAQIEFEKEKLKLWRETLNKIVPAITEYQTTRLEKVIIPVFRISNITFSLLLAVIIIGSGVLLYLDKLGASNFTFLLGIALGYLMSYFRSLAGGISK